MRGDLGAWAFAADGREGSAAADPTGLLRDGAFVGQHWALGVIVAEQRLLSVAT
jgi:hypothetical protein